jgi:glucose/arabinose dehydrogenase
MRVNLHRDRWPRTAAAVVAAGVLTVGALAAIAGQAGATPVASTTITGPPETPPPSGTPEPSVTPAPVPDLGAPEEVATGLTVPWGLASLPGGDALVAERETGRVLRVTPGGGPAQEVYVVPGMVTTGLEGGLLGLAVAPTHADDGYVYAYLNTATDMRIVRFRLGDPATEPEVVLAGLGNIGWHNGGRIAFGPDGMLYAGVGDAGNTAAAQDPAALNGKILRLTPEGDPAPDNPTPGSPVYSLGHRNVQGLAWDARGRLFASEFGQNAFDELNLIEPGRNYGWPVVEGTGDTQGGRFTNPLVTWPTSEASPSGIAIAGDTVYLAALRGQRLWTVPLEGDGVGTPVAELQGAYGRLRTVEVAPDGALWLTTSNLDGRGTPRDGDDRILRFPAR